MKESLHDKLASIDQLVRHHHFNDALTAYAELYQHAPSYFDRHGEYALTAERITHIQNAANLARRRLYDDVMKSGPYPSRVQRAFEQLLGLVPRQFQHPQQQPSFLYVDGLTASPFHTIVNGSAIDEIVRAIGEHKKALATLAEEAHLHYLQSIESLRHQTSHESYAGWLSEHIVKEGNTTPVGATLDTALLNVVSHPAVCDCPPHAPEFLISVLKPYAEIKPHYGLSNFKLTLHIPLFGVTDASLTAGGETFVWSSNDRAMLFDDSFLHSAKNPNATKRAVAIIDVWHPEVTQEEQVAIRQLVRCYEPWSKSYGPLAIVDAHLR